AAAASERADRRQGEEDPGVPELLTPVEAGERRRVRHSDRREVVAATVSEVALVHAFGPGLAIGQGSAEGPVAVAVVAEEEEALDERPGERGRPRRAHTGGRLGGQDA